MICYAKIEETASMRVSVGIGTHEDFYKSIGMDQIEVEQSDVDGAWYVKGYAPKKNEKRKLEEEKKNRIAELQKYLFSTDWYAIRFAETGVTVPEDIRARRQSSREEIDALRLELAVSNGLAE